jgi:hypothetical protein
MWQLQLCNGLTAGGIAAAAAAAAAAALTLVSVLLPQAPTCTSGLRSAQRHMQHLHSC